MLSHDTPTFLGSACSDISAEMPGLRRSRTHLSGGVSCSPERSLGAVGEIGASPLLPIPGRLAAPLCRLCRSLRFPLLLTILHRRSSGQYATLLAVVPMRASVSLPRRLGTAGLIPLTVALAGGPSLGLITPLLWLRLLAGVPLKWLRLRARGAKRRRMVRPS